MYFYLLVILPVLLLLFIGIKIVRPAQRALAGRLEIFQFCRS